MTYIIKYKTCNLSCLRIFAGFKKKKKPNSLQEFGFSKWIIKNFLKPTILETEP